MSWSIRYHAEVADDLDSLGRAAARRVMRVIDTRIHRGDPDKSGKPLAGELSGCRRIRTGDIRIVFKVDLRRQAVLILAVGPRRRDEAYRKAETRHQRQ